jgi:hypothetical protein
MARGLISLLFWLAVLAFIVLLYLLLAQPQRVVTPGSYAIIDAAKICPSLPRCFYQNVDTPYGRPLFAGSKLPTIDQVLGGVLLSPLQAIVVYGQAPPSDYWSFIPYLYKIAPTGAAAGDIDYSTIPVTFASMSDGVSDYMIHLPPDNQQVALIATRNRVVFDRERNYLIGTGFTGMIFPLYFTDIVKDTDVVVVLSRATNFPDSTSQQNYIEAPRMATYIVTYNDLPFVPVPISVETDNIKPNGIKLKTLPYTPTEVPLIQEFQAYTDYILQDYDVIADVSLRPFLSETLGVPYNNGYQCIAAGINCLGDNRQTYYGWNTPFAGEEGQQVIMIAINHANYGRAIYSQISIYDNDRQFGLASVRKFVNDPLFYSHVFTLGSSADYLLAERAYVDPSDSVGSDANTILPARAFIVTPRAAAP